MPSRTTLERAKKDKQEGKAASTQAGEFVREEMEHIRRGKHGARSTQQAIAIGLSKARRAGVDLKPPKKGRTSEKTRKAAERDYRKGQNRSSNQSGSAVRPKKSGPASGVRKKSPSRAREVLKKLVREKRRGLGGPSPYSQEPSGMNRYSFHLA